MDYQILREYITDKNLTPENWEIAHCAGPRGGLYLIPKSWDIQSNLIESTNPQLESNGRLKRYRILFEFFQLPQSG